MGPQVTAYLRDVEGGEPGFVAAWNEWLAGADAPNLVVLEVGSRARMEGQGRDVLLAGGRVGAWASPFWRW
jgi:hypothetical protein